MSQPPAYTRQFDFVDYLASYQAAPLPAQGLENEFDGIRRTLVALLVNLAKIQRDDGKLANASVNVETLSPAAIYTLGAGSQWKARGAWVTATAYAASDVISNGTASYVCAVAHSAGTFATDLAAGRWVLLFDSAGSIPADGSVTPAKLAAGAVTAPAIGFTSLDLSGLIRGGFVRAGTASAGIMSAKSAAGDVIITAERSTRAQGSVGLSIVGDGATWLATVPASSDDLVFASSAAGGITTTLRAATGVLDHGAHLRVTGASPPPDGEGVILAYASGTGYLDAYSHGASAWRPLCARGSVVSVVCSAVEVMRATSTGVDMLAGITKSGVDIGYLDIPQNIQSSAYTLALSDRGKHILSNNVAGQTIAIPTNASVPFPIGTAIVMFNNGSNVISISSTGITLLQAGTTGTGNRMIAAKGLATIMKIASDTWVISGVGVS